jgi:dolichol-phosphate mannosyltransferase
VSDTVVIIPTYNEIENIRAIVTAVMQLPEGFHVLVIDDGSPDGTAQAVQNLIQTTYPDRLFLEQRTGKLGLGTAYVHGFRWALARHYHFIVEMDADFSHPPDRLSPLREAASQTGVGMSIGSRYIRGGKLVNWPLNRLIMSYGASLYTRLVTFMPVHDSTAGFVCYRREALQQLNFDKIKFVGYAFQIEMKFAIWQLGFRLVEIPITFTDRQLGVSKMSLHIFREAVLGVFKMRVRSFFSDYR